MAKYSMIVPVYNCGNELELCVESLLHQTFRDFEILLVDDGSADAGGALCDSLAEAHGCIRAFHKENGGAASARNYGIDRAEGEFLLFIDGDDTIEPELLAEVEKTMAQGAWDMAIFGISFDYYQSAPEPERVELLSVKQQGLKDADFMSGHFRELFKDNALSSACNKVFPAARIRESGLRFREDMTLYEDLEFVLRYLSGADTVRFIDRPLYHYRINARNFAHKRVHELPSLRNNMNLLAQTLLSVQPRPVGAVDLAAELYCQLLFRHLLVTRYRRGELAPVYDYCKDAQLIYALEMGAVLGGNEKTMLELILSRKEGKLLFWLEKKRRMGTLRAMAKKTLKALGLRR